MLAYGSPLLRALRVAAGRADGCRMTDAIDSMGNDWLVEAGAPQEAETGAEARAPEPEVPAEETEQADAPQGEQEQGPGSTDQRQVPLAALKEEREKRQALERRLNEFESRMGQAPQPAPQPVRKAPDPYEDPDGYNAYVQSTVAQTEWNMRAEMSGRFAEQKFGRETVEQAIAWAQAEGAKDPTLGQRVTLQASPVEYVVQEYKRSQTLQALGDKSLDDYIQEQAVAKGWIVSQPGAEGSAPIQKPSSPTPPKSLSQAPGNGGIGKAPKEADWSEVKFALG